MKLSEIMQKSDKELATVLAEQRKQLSQGLMDLRTRQVSNVKQAAAHKKTIARILTVQRQRELTKEEANG